MQCCTQAVIILAQNAGDRLAGLLKIEKKERQFLKNRKTAHILGLTIFDSVQQIYRNQTDPRELTHQWHVNYEFYTVFGAYSSVSAGCSGVPQPGTAFVILILSAV
jgi:hypothetical protein